MAAFGDEADVRRLVGARRTIAAELTRIRSQGYAAGVEDNQPGLAALAAPISSIDGVAASVVVYTPIEKDRMTAVTRATDLVLGAATAISDQLTATEDEG